MKQGIEAITVQNILLCIKRLSPVDDIKLHATVGVLLRHLLFLNDTASLEWSNLGIEDLSVKSLHIALSPLEDIAVDSFEGGTDFKDGWKLANKISNATWIPVLDEFQLSVSNEIQAMYLDVVGKRKNLVLDEALCKEYPHYNAKSFCICRESRMSPRNTSQRNRSRNDDQIAFEDHLWISFDDASEDTLASSSPKRHLSVTQIKQTTREQFGNLKTCVKCEKCESLIDFARKVESCPDCGSENKVLCNFKSKIRSLDISNNSITSVYSLVSCSLSIKVLQNLEMFAASHNTISQVPCCFAQCVTNIKEIRLSHNDLSVFPVTLLVHCPNLTMLDISNNSLENWDENLVSSGSIETGAECNHTLMRQGSNSEYEISHENLLTLKMHHNRLTHFPSEICSLLSNLKILDISYNSIEELTEEKCNDKVSEMINLSHNSIMSVSHSAFFKMSKVKHIDLSWNSMHEIDGDCTHPSKAISLTKLNLSHNELTQFPAEFLHLRRLKSLDVSSNEIEDFTFTSSPTALLKELNLAENKITHISLFLKNVTGTWAHSLRSLRLNDNSLMTLPNEIGMLRSLEVLELHNNQLRQLPNDIGRLSKLYQLTLKGNKLDVDPNILEARTQDIRSYFFSRLKKSEQRFNVRMTILGTNNCDKQDFLSLLAKTQNIKQTVPKAEYQPAINVYKWSLKDKREFNITVWEPEIDQESIYSTHPHLLSCERSLYVLMYSCNADKDNLRIIRKWLVAIQANAANCPVILLAFDHGSAVSPNLFPKQAGFPCHITHNLHIKVQEMSISDVTEFSNCVSQVLNEHVVKGEQMFGKLVPKNYILIEEILCGCREQLKDFPVLSYSAMIDLIHNQHDHQLDLEDGEDLLSAIRFLTQAGVLFHQNDPRSSLKDNFIVEPLWLLRVIDKLITSLSNNMSVYDSSDALYLVPVPLMNVTLASLTTIEPGTITTCIPNKFVPVLLQLMKNQHIVILISNETYFVPYFLEVESPKNTPSLSHPLSQDQFMIRVIHLDYIPVDFWHHLIARLLSFLERILTATSDSGKITNTHCWQKGINVSKDRCVLFSVREVTSNEECWPWKHSKCSKSTSNPSSPMTEIVILVHKEYGHCILPALLDHLDITIEECYPDLLEFDLRGQQHVTQFVPCPVCLDRSSHHDEDENMADRSHPVHVFPLLELSSFTESHPAAELCMSSAEPVAMTKDGILEVSCPNHPETPVGLADLMPDVLMKDYQPPCELNPLYLLFNTIPESLLGEGGFGTVFKGIYAGNEAAIKTLRAGSSTPAYRSLRAELNILARFNHPSLIKLFGYMIYSESNWTPLMAMELAKKGSLATFLTSLENLPSAEVETKFPRFMRHRVALQILEGLNFLHGNKIIFRDMKPDNVLMMSLERDCPINVKLVDFGIAVPSTPNGTIGSSGSPGYSAPEVVALKMKEKQGQHSRILYTEKCDIFSFGLVLHEIATCRTPWFLQPGNTSALSSPPNIPDEAVLKGILPASLSTFDGVFRWPHIQDVISSSLKRNPDDRPTAAEILKLLNNHETCCFKYSIDIGNTTASASMQIPDDSFASGSSKDGSCARVQIWTAHSSTLVTSKNTRNLRDFFVDSLAESSATHCSLPSPPHTVLRKQEHAVNQQNPVQELSNSRFSHHHQLQKLSNLKGIFFCTDTMQVFDQKINSLEASYGDVNCLLCVPPKFLKNAPPSAHSSERFSSAMSFWNSLSAGSSEQIKNNSGQLNEPIVLAGTNKGKLVTLYTGSSKCCATLVDLKEEIFCLHLHQKPTDESATEMEPDIVVGLSGGLVAFFTVSQILRGNVRRPRHMIHLMGCAGENDVSSIDSGGKYIYATCGSHIVTIHVQDKGSPIIHGTRMISKAATSLTRQFANFTAVCHKYIYCTVKDSSHLYVWAKDSTVALCKTDVKSFINETDERHSHSSDTVVVTSLLTDVTRCIVYTGLNTGQVVLFTGACHSQLQHKSPQLITVVHRHEGPVWNISLIADESAPSGENDLILTFGVGYRSTSRDLVCRERSRINILDEEYSTHRRHSSSQATASESTHNAASYMAIYDANFPVLSKEMKQIERERERLAKVT